MARVSLSNGIITLLNFLTLIMSLGAIGVSFFLYVKMGSPCEKFLRMPLLVMGGALMAVSMAGLLGSCCRVSFFMWLYLITLFLLIVGLIGFTIFVIVVTNTGVGHALTATGMGTQRLGDYSTWMQHYVINARNWEEIKSCLIHIKVCDAVEGGGNYVDYYKHKISLIQCMQSGCCKPPNYCGMETKNGTDSGADPDCKIWSKEPTELCYECASCKAATLENIKREWRILAIVNTCILIAVTIIYSIGCCALRSNQSSRPPYSKYRNYYA